MNAQLLNPFTIDIPDSVASTIEAAECTTCVFNHGLNALHGQYLAVGRSDGYISIWDVETKSVVRVLSGHVRAVTALAWSSYNRYLASCSADWNVIVWDLAAKSTPGPALRSAPSTSAVPRDSNGESAGVPATSERKVTLRFDCPIASVQFAPGNSKKLLVVLASNQAWLVDITEKVRVRRRAGAGIEVDDVATSPVRIGLHTGVEAESPAITAARFTPDGRFIVAGTSKGSLLVFDSQTGMLLDEKNVLATTSGVKKLAFDAPGRLMVVNCNDRALRVLAVSTTELGAGGEDDRRTKRRRTSLELTLQHKIQDMIQRTAWNDLGFSPDSDYIYAGAAHKAAHNVYVWDRTSGTLVKMLEGPKDWLVGVDWCPHRPMLASVSNTGTIYLWFTPAEEIWSAYAPGFEELEENIEYEEREDEFDFIDDQDSKDRQKQQEQEAAHVRIQPHTLTATTTRKTLDPDHLFDRLNIPHQQRGQRDCLAFRAMARYLQPIEATSQDTWQDTDEVVLARADDDTAELFVIPPRLETDYSDFHHDV